MSATFFRGILAVLCCLSFVGCSAPDATDSSAGRGKEHLTDRQRMSMTVQELRVLGVDMKTWLFDQQNSDDAVAREILAEGDRNAWTLRTSEGDYYSFRRVSYQQVVELVAPRYVQQVPQFDAWGHAYEFAINSDLHGDSVLSIRSPGGNGFFDVDDYDVGNFPADQPGEDIVWADGQMVRWPDS